MYCTHCSEPISDSAEICPKCGVRQYKIKNFCYSCGKPVNEIQEICTSCGVNVKKGKSVVTGDGMHPAIPAALSFFLTGLGQILNGQVAKGITCLVGSMALGFITLGLSAIVTTPLVIVDAYLIAKKRKEGKQVGEWEFF